MLLKTFLLISGMALGLPKFLTCLRYFNIFSSFFSPLDQERKILCDKPPFLGITCQKEVSFLTWSFPWPLICPRNLITAVGQTQCYRLSSLKDWTFLKGLLSTLKQVLKEIYKSISSCFLKCIHIMTNSTEIMLYVSNK